MSSNASDRPDERARNRERGEYAGLNIGEDEYIIFDPENHQAWIQSSVVVAVNS